MSTYLHNTLLTHTLPFLHTSYNTLLTHTHCTTPQHNTLLTYILQHFLLFLPTNNTHAHSHHHTTRCRIIRPYMYKQNVRSLPQYTSYKQTYIHKCNRIHSSNAYIHAHAHTQADTETNLLYLYQLRHFNAVHVRPLSRPLSCFVLSLTPHPLSCTVPSPTPVIPYPTTPLPLYVSAPPHRPSHQHRLRLR